jgi:hypothetical protein
MADPSKTRPAWAGMIPQVVSEPSEGASQMLRDANALSGFADEFS